MQGINKLNIQWADDNHAHVQDPDNGREFDITVRQKKNMFVAGKPVKPRLFINGDVVKEKENDLSHRQSIQWAKDYFGPTLAKVLNKPVKLSFSLKAGCSCGCSPGFIIDDSSIPFNIWMNAK